MKGAQQYFGDSRPLRQVNCRNAGLADYFSHIVNGNALAGHNCDASGCLIHQLAEHGDPGLGIRRLTRGQNGAEAQVYDLFQRAEGIPAFIKCPVKHQSQRPRRGASGSSGTNGRSSGGARPGGGGSINHQVKSREVGVAF